MFCDTLEDVAVNSNGYSRKVDKFARMVLKWRERRCQLKAFLSWSGSGAEQHLDMCYLGKLAQSRLQGFNQYSNERAYSHTALIFRPWSGVLSTARPMTCRCLARRISPRPSEPNTPCAMLAPLSHPAIPSTTAASSPCYLKMITNPSAAISKAELEKLD